MEGKRIDKADAIAGGLFVLFGILFGLQALNLDLGTALRMGPGYFPLILSGLLVLFGLVILGGAVQSDGEPIGRLAWRGMLFILPAPIVFGLTVRGAGFVPAVFLAAFTAALASRRMSLLQAVLLAVAVTIFSTLVFSYALSLPFRRFGPWLPF
ncbi:tripartite tricarboxylate transporter TctB family protein [Chthonobacter rhizosphaerae]|uniref:tripartite tricarboxylate transporter TctB family protein n=1 Tax=Chthonobacter rhizosphaerae TaxID=2735553 RepID=UPI0015EF2EFD|nr:tripartite tricarboxylate transporter TctB family protein [Chthonobacter rhizosphaerae]